MVKTMMENQGPVKFNQRFSREWTQISKLQSLGFSSTQHFAIAGWQRQTKIEFRLLSHSWLKQYYASKELNNRTWVLNCKMLSWKFHCYHVNDCSNKILLIKVGAHFLSHCLKMPFVTERWWHFFLVQKCRPPLST